MGDQDVGGEGVEGEGANRAEVGAVVYIDREALRQKLVRFFDRILLFRPRDSTGLRNIEAIAAGGLIEVVSLWRVSNCECAAPDAGTTARCKSKMLDKVV